jgi:hypothetical protein
MKRKSLVMMLALVLGITCLSGCEGTTDNSADATSATQAQESGDGNETSEVEYLSVGDSFIRTTMNEDGTESKIKMTITDWGTADVLDETCTYISCICENIGDVPAEYSCGWFDFYADDFSVERCVSALDDSLLVGTISSGRKVEGRVYANVDPATVSVLEVEITGHAYTLKDENTDNNDTNKSEASAGNIPDFNGSWMDTNYYKYSMEIVSQNDAYYDISVYYTMGAGGNTYWEFSGEYDESQGGIVYTDGRCYDRTFTENGDIDETTVYSNGEGLIYMKGDKLYWNDKTSEEADIIVFERSESDESSEQSFPDADYILPNSDSVQLTESDIADLSLQEINYAKNEIYARHGRKFNSQELQNYFNSKSWYSGVIDGSDFDNSVLSKTELANIDLLTEAEFSIDANGYQLDK